MNISPDTEWIVSGFLTIDPTERDRRFHKRIAGRERKKPRAVGPGAFSFVELHSAQAPSAAWAAARRAMGTRLGEQLT